MVPSEAPSPSSRVGLGEVLVQWGRIGCIGFGGPPTHIALLRDLCVRQKCWIDDEHFEDAVTACNLLPGPASTQLSILCAWNVAGVPGAIVGGLAFILPGLIMIMGLSAIFLTTSPPEWILAAGAGAGAAVVAVAVRAGSSLVPASWSRANSRWRWVLYVSLGAVAVATLGQWLVLVLLGCGAFEFGLEHFNRDSCPRVLAAPAVFTTSIVSGGISGLVWVAIKVGLLSYGGGFVIIPMMQQDAVHRFQWMTESQFLNAVALGQITPGPVVLTIAVVGFAAFGVKGGIIGAVAAFGPSFVLVLVGARHFHGLRRSRSARAFLNGAAPAAIGAILGVSIPLVTSLGEPWQYAVVAGAAILLLKLQRGVVEVLLLAAIIGVVSVTLGAPLP